MVEHFKRYIDLKNSDLLASLVLNRNVGSYALRSVGKHNRIVEEAIIWNFCPRRGWSAPRKRHENELESVT
jgi:hypothetical protein